MRHVGRHITEVHVIRSICIGDRRCVGRAAVEGDPQSVARDECVIRTARRARRSGGQRAQQPGRPGHHVAQVNLLVAGAVVVGDEIIARTDKRQITPGG